MAAVVLLSASVSCTPVTRSYEIHTGQLGCEEANRHVHDALVSMGMIITAFRLAAPETDGYVRASKTDNRGIRKGEVRISCTASGVSIVASEAGLTLGSEHEFERGVFLSVTARARLTVDRGRILPAQAADPAAPQRAARVEHRTAGAMIGAAGAVLARGATELGHAKHRRPVPSGPESRL